MRDVCFQDNHSDLGKSTQIASKVRNIVGHEESFGISMMRVELAGCE